MAPCDLISPEEGEIKDQESAITNVQGSIICA